MSEEDAAEWSGQANKMSNHSVSVVVVVVVVVLQMSICLNFNYRGSRLFISSIGREAEESIVESRETGKITAQL